MDPTIKLQPLFNAIAAAIHEKDGLSDSIYAYNFPERIRAIPTDGVWVQSITITTPPATVVYLPGDTFDPTGMEVSAKFSNGQIIPVSLSNLTFSPSGPLEAGTKSVMQVCPMLTG